MDTHQEYLEIVDEDENIIGRANRDEVHDQGLLHREVHVWFCTSDKKIIFQKRALTKDTEPGLLDATAGGHIDEGFAPIQAALAEVEEETGISVSADELQLLGKFRKDGTTTNGRINNIIRYVYGYKFPGVAEDLRVEEGKSDGFEFYSVEQLKHLSEFEKSKFIAHMVESVYLEYFETLISD